MAEYTNNFSLKFKEGNVLELPSYTIAVPDGFEARTSVDGRDFVIRKRFAPDIEADLNGEDPLCGEIVLSHTPQEINLLIEGDCTSKQTADMLAALLFPGGGRGGLLKRFKTDLSVCFIEQMMNSFYITIVLNQRVFRMWLLVQDPAFQRDPTGEYPEFSEKNVKDIERMIKKWVSTIQSKDKAAVSDISEASNDELPPVEKGQASMHEQIEKYEASLDAELIDVLKMEAAAAKQKLNAFAQKVEESDFSRLRSIDGVMKRLMPLSHDDAFKNLSLGANYIAQICTVAYSPATSEIYVDGSRLTCEISCNIPDSPKELSKVLVSKIAAVSVEELYLSLLIQADTILEDGKKIKIKGHPAIARTVRPKGSAQKQTKKKQSDTAAKADAGKKKSSSKQQPRQAKKEKSDKQLFEERKKEIIEQRDKELAAFKKACAEISEKRKAEKKEILSAFKEALKEQKELLRKNYAAVKEENEKQLAEIQQQIDMQSSELTSLKWFDFSNKKRLKKAIADGKQRIADLEKKQADYESKYASDVQKAENDNAQDSSDAVRKIEEKYPLPQDSENAIRERAEMQLMDDPYYKAHPPKKTVQKTTAQLDVATLWSIMDDLQWFLDRHKGTAFTCAELIERGMVFPGTISSRQAAMICNKLVAAGRAENGVLNGKTVFMSVGTFDTIKGIRYKV